MDDLRGGSNPPVRTITYFALGFYRVFFLARVSKLSAGYGIIWLVLREDLVLNSLIEKKEGGRVTLKVTIPAQDFDKNYAEAIKRAAREHNFPGFRKGHAPKPIIISRLGESYLLSEAASLSIYMTQAQAMKDNNIQPIGDPQFDVEQVNEHEDFIYTLTVEVMPEINLPEYKGVKAVKKIRKISDTEVDEFVENTRKRQAQLVAIEDRDTVENGDYILFDFKGFINDEPFEGGAAENYTLKIGSNSFIPGFEDQMIGKKIGEAGEVHVNFPEDYHQESLAGKPAVFKVTVKEIKKEELPELDDEFAKDLGKETLAEFKDQVRSDLEKQAENAATYDLENSILNIIADQAEFDVPPSMIEMQIDSMVTDFKARVEYQGISWETYLEHSGKNVDEIKKDFEPKALQAVKNFFILRDVAKLENITVADEELDAKFEELAAGYQVSKEMIREYYENNNRVEDLRHDILTEKTLRFLVDNASVEEEEFETETK